MCYTVVKIILNAAYAGDSTKQLCLSDKELLRERNNKMKIAVTYQNGIIFQHFGKSAAFKYYTTDDKGNIIAAEVKSNNGQGHGALADILRENGAKAVICGGIGEGAQNALAANGIEVYAGNTGSADAAAIAFFAGKIEKKAVQCDHHNHTEGHSCSAHSCK